jgi:hypothetical protein
LEVQYSTCDDDGQYNGCEHSKRNFKRPTSTSMYAEGCEMQIIKLDAPELTRRTPSHRVFVRMNVYASVHVKEWWKGVTWPKCKTRVQFNVSTDVVSSAKLSGVQLPPLTAIRRRALKVRLPMLTSYVTREVTQEDKVVFNGRQHGDGHIRKGAIRLNRRNGWSQERG